MAIAKRGGAARGEVVPAGLAPQPAMSRGSTPLPGATVAACATRDRGNVMFYDTDLTVSTGDRAWLLPRYSTPGMSATPA